MELTEKNREKIQEVLRRNNVVLAYVFGSTASGSAGPLSDLDIAVVFSENSKHDLERELAIAHEVSKAVNIEPVDVINLSQARDPLLKHKAVFSGIPILVANQNQRFALERAITREYEDTRYLREAAFSMMRRRIKSGTFGMPARL